MWGLLLAFIVTLFVPKPVALPIGSINMTPSLAVSIVLFPALLIWGRIRWTWPDLLVAIFYVSKAFSLILTSPLAASIESFGRQLLIGLVPYLVGRYLGSRPAQLKPFLRVTLAAMAVFGIFALLESVFRFNLHSWLWRVPYQPHHEQRFGLTRAHGWTNHAIMLGLSYAVFVPVIAVIAIEKLRGIGQYRFLKLGLMLIGVFCSLSTGAWLPAAVAVGLVCWDYWSFLKPGVRWLLISFGSVSLYFILEVLSGRPLLRILMMELHLSSPQAWYYRWRLYERVYGVMPDHWWFGYGIVTPRAFTNTVQWSIDNNYLVVLMNYGRVGLALWISISVAVVAYGWKSVWRAPDSSYVRLARAVMFGIVTMGLTQLSVALFSTASMLYWLFLGLALGMAQGLASVSDGRVKHRAKKRTPRHSAMGRPSTSTVA